MLRKYISYAKQIDPILTDEAMNRLKEFYLQMRNTESGESPIAITARQLEGLIRLSEARARAALRKEITVEDAQAAIDIIMTGRPKSVRDRLQVVISLIMDAEKTVGMISEEALYDRLENDYGIQKMEASNLLNQLTRDGMIYSPRPGYYKKT
jgi:replicative DNA helicase Mcm